MSRPAAPADRARLAHDAIAAASVAGHDGEAMLRAGLRALRRAVPHEAGGWCTVDPGTMLWTGGIVHGLPDESAAAVVDIELLREDGLKFTKLAQERVPVGVLSEAMGGDLERSPRFREVYRPHGLADELRVAFMADGQCYGIGCLVRRAGDAPFSAQERALVASLSKPIAQGLRTALVRSGVSRPVGGQRGPGVLVLDDEGQVLSATEEADAWLEVLGHVRDRGEPLPPAVLSVARRARAILDGGADGPPRIRVRTRAGWLTVHASAFAAQAPRTWAVVLEPARPAEVLPLLATAHELTPREQEVFGLLLRGAPDKQIAQRLVVSDHTAREHVRKVQRKLRVRSRTELQALMHDVSAAQSA